MLRSDRYMRKKPSGTPAQLHCMESRTSPLWPWKEIDGLKPLRVPSLEVGEQIRNDGGPTPTPR